MMISVLPGLPSLTLSHLGDIFREGESISMTCQSVGGKPLPTITWMKNGVQLVMPSMDVTGNVSRSTLNVTLSHSDHGANYTCFVYNLLNEYQPLIVSRIFSVQCEFFLCSNLHPAFCLLALYVIHISALYFLLMNHCFAIVTGLTVPISIDRIIS